MVERVTALRHVNVAALALIAAFNFIDCISNGRDVGAFLFFVGPFVAALAAILIWRNYKTNAIVYGLCGVLLTITGSSGNFAGVIFIIFSIYIFNSTVTTLALLICAAVAIASRCLFLGYTIPDTLNIMVAYAYTLGIYFILMHPKHEETPIVARVDADTLKIIEYVRAGLKTKEIAGIVCLSVSAVYKRIERAKATYDCGNNAELVRKLEALGLLSQKIDNSE